jgi:dihydrofolate reductase
MKKPKISIIVAISSNTRAIGKDNALLWSIPDDLKRFRTLTTGHPIIMGRKTFESIGRPLPNRTNIVISRKNIEIPGVIVVHSVEDAILEARKVEDDEIFIIGGSEIYRSALHLADIVYLTIVTTDTEGDVFFPEYKHLFTKETFHEDHTEHDPPYTFINLEK